MKSKLTLKQIALELGVSVSTVSKALNDSAEISDPTRIRIKEFAKLKNYKPNSLAKNLKYQRTNTIGVIIPNILNPFFAKVFSGIEKEANKNGFNVITCISNESFEKEKQAIDLLSNGTVDGFIVSVAEETELNKVTSHFKETISEGIPIVMFDRISDFVNCDKVIVDDLESSFEAINYLIKTGCKNIALLSCIDNLSVGKLRADGYLRALMENNIPINENFIIRRNFTDDFDDALKKLIDAKGIDAVFAIDEHSSTMAMKMAIQNGYAIPEDISIIGFADGVWSRRLTPSLSTISQHGPEIGQEAARLLISKIKNKKMDDDYEYKTVVIKTELRQRDSTKKLTSLK
ncbi:LacI family DNA-binding transcriptional regulator [Flavobacterium sp.]|uniref:LacI family DNA-binding transcriptional regulator n=1 Tax=Flavobacterium sp. TaxID=239 RepID=UPI00286E5BA2|nr:LacI family DNA-binding transcriptional regulator [Flavobacterium sp.]